MGRLQHKFVMAAYGGALKLAATFGHQQARAWRAMRSPEKRQALQRWAAETDEFVWFHCASLGEFEQTRPVMEACRKSSNRPFLLTFFSPSGYEPVMRKRPDCLGDQDFVAALPLDLPGQLAPFLAAIGSKCKGFATVKYEVWPELLAALKARGIPRAIFAVHLPDDHWLARRGTETYREAWRTFNFIAVQTPDSAARLNDLDIPGAVVLGDPRADRTRAIAAEARSFPALERWASSGQCVVAGSTWPAEEKALIAACPRQLILAPHALDSAHLEALRQQLAALPHLFTSEHGGLSDMVDIPADIQVVVVDEMGHLASLYALAQVALVGGGWGAGIHNTLEPAAHGVPIVTGPRINRFQEAQALQAAGALFTFADPSAAIDQIHFLLTHLSTAHSAGESARAYVAQSAGAADAIAEALLREWA